MPNPGTIHGLHTPSYHLSLCATHQKQRTLSEKLNTLKRTQTVYSLLTYSKRRIKTHSQKAATSAAKVKLNVTTTLLTYLFGENRTLGTFSQQEIHEKTTRIHKSSHFSCKPTHAQSFYYSYMETTQETRNSKAYKCHSQQ